MSMEGSRLREKFPQSFSDSYLNANDNTGDGTCIFPISLVIVEAT